MSPSGKPATGREGIALKTEFSPETIKKVLAAQRNELTEHLFYLKLSNAVKNPESRDVLKKLSQDELAHYRFWKGITGTDVKASGFKLWFFYIISLVFGITFGIKLMEKGEDRAQNNYKDLASIIPEAGRIAEEEGVHEKMLIELIDEERLRYVGSIVLGLNDALVELTGALAGFTLALQNTRLTAMMGLITGIAASLSMAASEYLSTKSEENGRHPVKASVYTGAAYMATVFFLVLPFFILSHYMAALGLTLLSGLLVIVVFSYYTSVPKDLPFWSRFFEMAAISLGVATLSFGIGYLVRHFMGIEM